MKKLLICFAIIAIAFSACKKHDGYIIKGQIDGVKDQTLLLVNSFTEKTEEINLKNGKFKFKGKVDVPTKFYLTDADNSFYKGFFLENENIMLSGADDFSNLKVEGGGPAQQEYLKLKEVKKKFHEEFHYDKMVEKYKKAKEKKDFKTQKILSDKFDDFYKKQEEYLVQFVKNNPKSHVAALALPKACGSLNPIEAENMIKKLDPSLHNYPPIEKFKKELEKRKLVMVGKTIPDFTMNDVNGKPVKLSEQYAKSKYLLVEFWASWCGPCRLESPVLVKAYTKYKRRGFNILSVSLDKDKEKWLEAIKKDKLTWKHVSDLKGWENEVAASFGVKGIPTNFLLDKNGKIVASNLKGAELEGKLKKLLPYRRRR